MFQRKGHISELPPFGCEMFVHVDKDERLKGEDHAWVGFNAGPVNNHRVYRPTKHHCYLRYHVLADPTILYGDFMGKRYRDRLEVDKLQRDFYNEEITALLNRSDQHPSP